MYFQFSLAHLSRHYLGVYLVCPQSAKQTAARRNEAGHALSDFPANEQLSFRGSQRKGTDRTLHFEGEISSLSVISEHPFHTGALL